MKLERIRTLASLVVSLTFMALLLVTGAAVLSGDAWIVLDAPAFNVYLWVVVCFTVVVSGIAFTYSFFYYGQMHNLRSLVLLFLALDLCLLVLLYGLTHPVMEIWGYTFAGRNENRSMVALMGLVVAPGVLLYSFAGDAEPVPRNKVLYSLFGGLVIPLLAVLSFFTPGGLLKTTEEIGGVQGLTPAGWFIAVSFPLANAISLFMLLREHRSFPDHVVSALIHAIVLWSVASVIFTFLWNPLQIAELLYLSCIAGGLCLIDVAMIIGTVLEPFRTLEVEVTKRSAELDLSRQESDFLLSCWAHKVGNLLQGIVTHLELFSMARESNQDLLASQAQASELARQTTAINRQVLWISEAKANRFATHTSVPVRPNLLRAYEVVSQMYG
ncbi:MAG: hypothetical protein HXY34_06190, partial [Candidatus Thorarchaeota archaeon]|nr:hypothetical protein [Candidatus Thorarchaeota archaeon]